MARRYRFTYADVLKTDRKPTGGERRRQDKMRRRWIVAEACAAKGYNFDQCIMASRTNAEAFSKKEAIIYLIVSITSNARQY